MLCYALHNRRQAQLHQTVLSVDFLRFQCTLSRQLFARLAHCSVRRISSADSDLTIATMISNTARFCHALYANAWEYYKVDNVERAEDICRTLTSDFTCPKSVQVQVYSDLPHLVSINSIDIHRHGNCAAYAPATTTKHETASPSVLDSSMTYPRRTTRKSKPRTSTQ